jgi:HTH-type transcriptional regulator/antitoxin HipB
MSLVARSPKQLGTIIQRTRKQRGLSQTEVANLVGLRQEKVSKVESGQEGAKLSTIFALLAALDLEISIDPRAGKPARGIGDIF